MYVNLVNGFTSYQMAESIAKMMAELGVDDEYLLVSKYYSVGRYKNRKTDQKFKIILLDYDSEGFVAENKAHLEIEYFDRVIAPHLIVTFGDIAYKYLKKRGFNVYKMDMGYDDLTYKSIDVARDIDIGFAGTVDDKRFSLFYTRHMILDTLMKINYKNMQLSINATNTFKYHELSELYSKCLIGLNDLVFPTPNMRCYEIPVHGAVMVVNNLVEFEYPLKKNKHYFVYDSLPELLEVIYNLKNDREKTIDIGESAREIILKYPLSKEVAKMVKHL